MLTLISIVRLLQSIVYYFLYTTSRVIPWPDALDLPGLSQNTVDFCDNLQQCIRNTMKLVSYSDNCVCNILQKLIKSC